MLFNLRVCGDSVFSLDSAEDVGDYDPTLVSWISLGDSAVNGLLITYDIPLEGDVGTLVYLLKGSELSLVFNDAEGTCKPAELNDVDGDGSPELIVYSGDLSRGDCSNTCLIVLRRHFNMTPAWVDVRRSTGSAWVSADADYPTFYRRLADVYGEIASWLAGGPDHEHCKNVYWLRDPKAFENLASQARALVSNR